MRRPYAVLASVLLIAGCGYRFARGPSALLPEGTTLAVPVFENDTIEAGFEATVAEALRREFAAVSSVRIAEREDAALVLSGKVIEATSRNLSVSKELLVVEERRTVAISARLARGEKVLWSAKRIEADETYYATADNVATEDNRKEALARAARALAKKVYLRVSGGWS